MNAPRTSCRWLGTVFCGLVLSIAALAPLVLPGCGLAYPVAGVIAASGSSGGGSSAHHAQTMVVIETLPPPEQQEARNELNQSFWQVVVDRTVAAQSQNLPEDQLRHLAAWRYLRVLSQDAEEHGINAVPWLGTQDTVFVEGLMPVDGDGIYRLADGATIQVTVSGQQTETFSAWGSCHLTLQPSLTGWTGTLTGLKLNLIHQGADPRTLTVLELDRALGALPSTITLQPDPGNPQMYRGDLHLIVQAEFGSPGDPVLALLIPVKTTNPLAYLQLSTDGVAVPGPRIFPNYASQANPNADCNNNSIPDGQEIATGSANDCNHNGVPDACDIQSGHAGDCNGNGVPDPCELVAGTQGDVNMNGLLEGDCETVDCNSDGTNDFQQLSALDANHNGIVDSCEIDCNGNGLPDYVDIGQGTSTDCNHNEVPDDCEPNADGDSRIDACDGCPTDPLKITAGVCGCGTPEQDLDGDGRATCQDCDDQDGAVWATPGEVRNLRLVHNSLTHQSTLSWDPPADSGGSLLAYDTISSPSPTGFLTAATCVESNDGPNTTSVHTGSPGAGQALYFEVRAENACPSGQGPLGKSSAGVVRPGRSCPACVNGLACEDGFFCTADETCQSGICGGGSPRSCTDGNACTADLCSESTDACLHDPVPMNGRDCSTGLYCTVGTTCTAGACSGGAPRNCSDANACTTDACNEGTDACEHPSAPGGTPCDDGQFCTQGEACNGGGACTGGAGTCDDGNGCTNDICSESGDYCSHGLVANGASCDDGSFCTSGETCTDGCCGEGVPTSCSDGNPCTADNCNEAGNTCENPNLPDGTPCGSGHVCRAGGCRLTNGQTCAANGECDSAYCVDEHCCTTQTCGSGETCANPQGACKRQDGQGCTAPAQCNSNYCVDEHCCTTQTCGSGETCANPQGVCKRQDGQGCTAQTQCNSNTCADQVCCNMDCGSPCESCNQLGHVGECTDDPNGTACDDSQFCTADDSCNGLGSCQGTVETCDDGSVCTDNVCDSQALSCSYTCNITPCMAATLGAGVVSALSTDASLNPVAGAVYVAQPGVVTAVDNTGTIKWTWTDPSSSTINNFPSPVPLSSGGIYLFIGATDGYVYKINAETGAQQWSVDLRRPSCPSGDQISAAPMVQRYDLSNASYQSVWGPPGQPLPEDLVYVVTHYGCSSTTGNKIYALRASTGAVAWTFNGTNAYQMDYGSEGGAVDYGTNTVYFGTNLPSSNRDQNTLWAVDTINGALKWSTNAGPIRNRPQLGITGSNRLYVATFNGVMKAYNTTDGSRIWSTPVTGSTIVLNPSVMGQPGPNTVFLGVDSAGTLHAVTDRGTEGVRSWAPVVSVPSFTTSPVVLRPTNMVYLGLANGTVKQIDLTTGTVGASRTLGTGTVFALAVDLQGPSQSVDQLVGAVVQGPGSAVKRLCIPWIAAPQVSACQSAGECAPFITGCATAACHPRGVCYRQAVPDTTPCDDGAGCTSGDSCASGACLGGNATACPCASPGDHACPSGQTCCGGGGCVDLSTSLSNCGACGNACSPDQKCVVGACRRDTTVCSATAASTLGPLSAGTLSGGDAIAFDRDPLSGTCSAYVARAATTGTPSGMVRVDPTGLTTPWQNPSSPDLSPENGVAVATDGKFLFAAVANEVSGVPPSYTPTFHFVDVTRHLNTTPLTTFKTFGTAPFSQQQYNQGPVLGPALDTAVYNGTSTSPLRVYIANWNSNGQVLRIDGTFGGASYSWVPGATVYSTTPPSTRVDALAYVQRPVPGAQKDGVLYVAYGKTLAIVCTPSTNNGLPCVGGPYPVVLDLNNPNVYGNVAKIFSIATDPLYGDAYIEVGTTTLQRKLLVLRADDLSVRSLLDVQIDLKVSPVVPAALPGEGRLGLSPARLERIAVPSPVGGPPTFMDVALPY